MYRLIEAEFTVNLVKSEFRHVHLIFLAHVVDQGQIKLVATKVEAIVKFPVPINRIGMTGCYRKFCRIFCL